MAISNMVYGPEWQTEYERQLAELNAKLADPLNAAKAGEIDAAKLALQNQLAQYNAQGVTYGNQYNQGAQQAYIANMQQQRNMPTQLANAGILGQGTAESTINSMNNNYRTNQNNLLTAYNEALRNLDVQKNAAQSTSDQTIAGINSTYAQRLSDAQKQAESTAYSRITDAYNAETAKKQYEDEQAWKQKEWDYQLQQDALTAARSGSGSGSLAGTKEPSKTKKPQDWLQWAIDNNVYTRGSNDIVPDNMAINASLGQIATNGGIQYSPVYQQPQLASPSVQQTAQSSTPKAKTATLPNLAAVLPKNSSTKTSNASTGAYSTYNQQVSKALNPTQVTMILTNAVKSGMLTESQAVQIARANGYNIG